MKKLIFLFLLIFLIWKFDIVQIAINKYLDYKYGTTSDIQINKDKEFTYNEISENNNKNYPQTTNIQDDNEIDLSDVYVPKKIKLSIPKRHTHKIKLAVPTKKTNQKYRCDGRTWCSQMHSCEEAIFFSSHCSDTMDSDNDGRPCESQWCGH